MMMKSLPEKKSPCKSSVHRSSTNRELCAEIFSSMVFLSKWIYVQGIVLLRQLLLAKVQIVACCYLAAPINCGLLKSYILCYTAGCSMRKKMQLEKEESKFFPSCHFVKKVPPKPHSTAHDRVMWCRLLWAYISDFFPEILLCMM